MGAAVDHHTISRLLGMTVGHSSYSTQLVLLLDSTRTLLAGVLAPVGQAVPWLEGYEPDEAEVPLGAGQRAPHRPDQRRGRG